MRVFFKKTMYAGTIVFLILFFTVPSTFAQSCANDTDCPSGQECRDGSSRGFQGLCVLPCSSGRRCPTGYSCENIVGGRGEGCILTPGTAGTACTSNAGCASGLKCNQTNGVTGECIATTQNIGESCLVNSECDSNFCKTLNRSTRVCALPAGSATIPTPSTGSATVLTPTTAPSALPTSSSSGTIQAQQYQILSDLTSLNPLSARSVPVLIGQVVRFVTGLFGSIALLLVIYGGIRIMLAGGQGDKVKEGAKVIAWASIGLVTMMLSYVLVSFVLGVF